jgi:iron complex transport system substrate-binding protein
MFPPLLEDFLTIDSGVSHVIAASGFHRETMRESLLGHIYPQAQHIPVAATEGIGSTVPGDPEQLLALNADAIFSWTWFSEPLQRLGLPVAGLRFSPSRKQAEHDTFESWRSMAALAGRRTRAEEVIARYLVKMNAVEQESSRMNTRPPTVLFLYLYRPGLIGAAGGDLYTSQLIEMAHGENESASYSQGLLNIEELLMHDPDVILYSCGGEDADCNRWFAHDPALQPLRALQARKIYRSPAGYYRVELVNSPLLLRWMAELLHPDQMPHALRQEYRATYHEVYGYDLSDEEIDAAIFVKDNLASSGYARFLVNSENKTEPKAATPNAGTGAIQKERGR